MNYSFIVRKAEEKDVVAISQIMRAAFTKYAEETKIKISLDALEESEASILNDIISKEVYIALIDNIPVGSIRMEIRDDKTAYISRFGVVSSYHSMGIGKTLMTFADKVCIERGITKAFLHTASNYTSLVRFYYGCGFYILSTTTDRGYVRALLVKEYTYKGESK